jgi:isoleucyl-tRNA synthetase
VRQNYETFEFYNVYHAIQNFCIVDMSNFYLDVIKDRLYVEKTDGFERRSAQTVIYLILNSLVKMIAPILSYTAEEIWKYMPHLNSENTESVFLNDMNSEISIEISGEFISRWDRIHKIRDEIKKILEIQRKNKVIGSSLEADVTIYCDGELFEFIKECLYYLKLTLMVSEVKVEASGKGEYKAENIKNLSISISHSHYQKCERCWNYSETVGKDTENPTICERCSSVLK